MPTVTVPVRELGILGSREPRCLSVKKLVRRKFDLLNDLNLQLRRARRRVSLKDSPSGGRHATMERWRLPGPLSNMGGSRAHDHVEITRHKLRQSARGNLSAAKPRSSCSESQRPASACVQTEDRCALIDAIHLDPGGRFWRRVLFRISYFPHLYVIRSTSFVEDSD